MRIAVIVLILLVIGGLVWVGTETWSRGSEGIDVPGSKATVSLEAEDAIDGEADVSISLAPAPEAHGLPPVRGHIIGPDGQPVVGARVTLIRLSSAWPEMKHEAVESGVYSDKAGRFLFQTSRGDDLMIDVFHRELARKRVPAPKEVASLTIPMEYGFEVNGEVEHNTRSVVVSLEPRSGGFSRAVNTSLDARGFFSFKNVPAGLARVSVRHPRLPITSVPSVTVGSQERLRIGLPRLVNTVIRGAVHPASAPDEPVVNAEIRIYQSTAWDSGLLEPIVTRTDAQGNFRLRGLTAGNLRMEVHHPEYSTALRILPRGRRDARLEFELLPRSRVHGRLRGADLTGVRISLVSSAGEIGWATVDATGSFEFPELISNGRAVLEIEDGVWAFAESSSRYLDITIREGGGTSLDLAVATPSVLSGRVVDAQGNPLAGVTVSTPRRRVILRSPERLVTVTDDDGRYEFRGLVVGTIEVFMGNVELLFEHDEYAPKYVAATGATDQGEVIMVRPGVIQGQVTRGGEPLPGALVFAGLGNRNQTTVVSGPDGRYRLGSLPPGSYRVKVRYSTLSLQVADELAEVVSGEVCGPIDIDIPTGEMVHGLVTDSLGVPVAEASVLAIGNFDARIITRTDQLGSFILEVPEGAEELEVVSPDLQVVVRVRIDKQAGQTLPEQEVIRLPLVPRASLKARVLGLPGRRPITSGVVRIEPLDAAVDWDENTRRQRSVPARWVQMPNGELRMDEFPAGRSRLTLQCPGFSPFVMEVSLTRNEIRDNSAGVPVAGAVAHLGEELDLFEFDARMVFRTDASGEFEIGGVTPSGKRLVIYAEGYATRVIDLEYPSDLMRSEPMSIVLQPATAIVVNVKNAEGRAQSSGWVVLLRDGVRLDIEEPDEEGVVSFLARGAGTYQVSLLGQESEGQEVVVTEDSNELQVDLLVRSN
ncbi:MAG: carboxypeptidase regulatory-like domain-containing protein [Planctomycetota bacterium]|jgi:hypothetical protein